MKTKAKKEIKLEDFSKEVLIKFIKECCFYRIDEIERIKWKVEVDTLLEKSKKNIEESAKLKLPEQFPKYIRLMNEHTEIQKKLDKLLGTEVVEYESSI